ncbi:MAG: hypothetical protein U1E87_08225 [Alphaproteobacteria bacterium]
MSGIEEADSEALSRERAARLIATVDFPTPPLPEATATIFFTFAVPLQDPSCRPADARARGDAHGWGQAPARRPATRAARADRSAPPRPFDRCAVSVACTPFGFSANGASAAWRTPSKASASAGETSIEK